MEVSHVQVEAFGIHKASNQLKNLFCWHERVLLLLKLMIEILNIDHKSDLSILLGNSKPWEAPIATFDLFLAWSPHCAKVALSLKFSFKHLCASMVWGMCVCVCVCVNLTSSSGGLPSDAVPTARQIHPPQRLRRHTPSDSVHQFPPGENVN